MCNLIFFILSLPRLGGCSLARCKRPPGRLSSVSRGRRVADGAAVVAAPLERHTSGLKRSAETLKHVRGGNFLLPDTSCALADRVLWQRVRNVAAPSSQRSHGDFRQCVSFPFFCQTSVISQSVASCPESPDSSLTLAHTHSRSHSCSLPLAPEQCSSL